MSEWGTDTVTVRVQNTWGRGMKVLKAGARIGATVVIANCSNIPSPAHATLIKESKNSVDDAVESRVVSAILGVTPEDFRMLAVQIRTGTFERSPEHMDAARQALARLQARANEDRTTWAKRLADEASEAVD